jgi:8-oxo-dGTP pyrophosphatase MutT (NUDIX family)
MHAARVIELLAGYRPRHPAQAQTIARVEAFVKGEPRCFERDCWTGHVTGSAWLVDASGAHVLLTHHRKLNRWLQLGGHSDGDDDPLRVACREAEEESGLTVTPVSDDLFDVDIHLIPARGTDPAHHHFDLRFVLRAGSDERFAVSGESHALSWVKVDELARFTNEISMLRMAEKWKARRATAGLRKRPTTGR